MILYRCFAWNAQAPRASADGPLWFPRPFQGEGRHDNPDLYGCLYSAEQPASCLVEHFSKFRGRIAKPSWLQRRGLPVALAALELPDREALIDLDDPAVLNREQLRPSRVATRNREVTQSQARVLFTSHSAALGLRWWSTFEASWINVTLFDRATALLRVHDVRTLTLEDPEVIDAAHTLGLR